MPVTELASPCPHCGSVQLTPSAGGALCLGCRRCWAVEGGVVRWVSPYRCAGCALSPLCLAVVDDHHEVAVLSAPVRRPRSRAHPSFAPVLRLVPTPLPPTA